MSNVLSKYSGSLVASQFRTVDPELNLSSMLSSVQAQNVCPGVACLSSACLSCSSPVSNPYLSLASLLATHASTLHSFLCDREVFWLTLRRTSKALLPSLFVCCLHLFAPLKRSLALVASMPPILRPFFHLLSLTSSLHSASTATSIGTFFFLLVPADLVSTSMSGDEHPLRLLRITNE